MHVCAGKGRKGGKEAAKWQQSVARHTHVAKSASTSSLRVGKFDAVLQTRNEGLLLS